MLLVVGGTGQVGAKVVRDALTLGSDVRILARAGSQVDDLVALGADIVRGDLADPDSLAGACVGVTAVVATASAIVPKPGERTGSTALTNGYRRLGEEAAAARVRRFVFVSVPRQQMSQGAAEFDEKAKVEADLQRHDFALCVVRPSLFMESWLPAVGSRLAVAGVERATIDRGFWLARFAGAVLHRSIDRWGVAQVPGRADVRHSFVSGDDVGAVVARLALAEDDVPSELPVGGPQALTWPEVAAEHGAVLGRRVRQVRVPSGPFTASSRLLSRVSPTASHLLAVQSLVGRVPTVIDSGPAAAVLGRPLVSVPDFLRARRASSVAAD